MIYNLITCNHPLFQSEVTVKLLSLDLILIFCIIVHHKETRNYNATRNHMRKNASIKHTWLFHMMMDLIAYNGQHNHLDLCSRKQLCKIKEF